LNILEISKMAKKTRVAKEKILEILAEHRAGASIADLQAKHGVSASTIYNWKSRAANGGKADKPARRGRARKTAPAASAPAPLASKPPRGDGGLIAENERLKVMLVDMMLERDALRARLARR
jgi:transposase-like protein